MSKQQLKERGFTIIEVVLVLAIAALIFLMVFIALPALQGSQRDTARKEDVSTVASAINSWTSNNRGAATLTDTALRPYWENHVSRNTTTVNVRAALTAAQAVTVTDATIDIYPRATCGEQGGSGTFNLRVGTARQYALVTRVEAGNGSAFCQQL